MRVVVELDTVSLVEPSETRSFSVVVRGAVPDVGRELAHAGWGADAPEPGHVLVRVDRVRQAATSHVSAAWEDDFATMLRYAESKGWMDASGELILAHVVVEG